MTSYYAKTRITEKLPEDLECKSCGFCGHKSAFILRVIFVEIGDQPIVSKTSARYKTVVVWPFKKKVMVKPEDSWVIGYKTQKCIRAECPRCCDGQRFATLNPED